LYTNTGNSLDKQLIQFPLNTLELYKHSYNKCIRLLQLFENNASQFDILCM